MVLALEEVVKIYGSVIAHFNYSLAYYMFFIVGFVYVCLRL